MRRGDVEALSPPLTSLLRRPRAAPIRNVKWRLQTIGGGPCHHSKHGFAETRRSQAEYYKRQSTPLCSRIGSGVLRRHLPRGGCAPVRGHYAEIVIAVTIE